MPILTAILTHLPGDLVDRQLAYLRELSPESRFVVCHGGARADFEGVRHEPRIFIEDPSLRGPHFDKSVNDTLKLIYDSCVRDDPGIDFVYLIEYDHLVLAGDFERRLESLARECGAGLLGKTASVRNDTNWSHYHKLRHNRTLNEFIDSISVRDDRSLRFGCLGTGVLLRRDALEAFCALVDSPPFYVELFVPTVVYHLGFEVIDVDAISDLYRAVRWLPEYSGDEVVAHKRDGRAFVHPFKGLDELDSILAAPPQRPAVFA